MDLMLHGKVAVITGPAKGMGAAITRAFAQEGCRLALLARDTAAVQPLAAELAAAGVSAITVPCDLRDAGQCEYAAAQTLAAFGRTDILGNIAGGFGPIGMTGA